MSHSYVVTGGGRGIGRVLVERLLGMDDTVVAKVLILHFDCVIVLYSGRLGG
jgi:NAD(P)-dependent dehydrogenase (short-subunit alcohol dehydrogenase family)